jgi:hypothetical protein
MDQLELDLEYPEIRGYIVELRKGNAHDLHTERSLHADDLNQVASAVGTFRNHASVFDNVTWVHPDRVVVGSSRGLAPKGVVWEIAVTPAITIDA